MATTIASTDVGGTGLSTVGTNGQVLTSNGTTLSWQTPSAGTSFSAGTTGFTPNTATTGTVTLAGTLGTANGGTNLTSFTSGGALYATSTSALTTGTLPIASGGTGLTSFTTGQILFGSFSQSANLFWDSANNRLGIGTNNPTYTLQVAGNAYTNQTVISGNNVIITSTNLNSLKTAGNYIGYNLTNAPSASGSAWCTVEVFTNGSDQVFQRATPAQYASNSVWNRMSTDGGTTWGSWIKESGTGSVIQVVQATYAVQTASSSTTPATTGLTASITPSSTSSKILVLVSNPMRRTGGTLSGMAIYLYRNGSQVFQPMSNMGYSNPSTADISWMASFNYLDSPASASSVTYAMYFAANGGTSYAQIDGGGNNSSMILLEIAG